MALKVYTLGNPPISSNPPAALAPFTFTVPGQYRWTVLSIFATLSRASGGTNTRAPVLTVTDGTKTVLGSQFLDTAADPGTLSITWCNLGNVQPATYATGFVGVPLPTYTFDPGYILTGAIANPSAGDQWLTAVVWVDQTST